MTNNTNAPTEWVTVPRVPDETMWAAVNKLDDQMAAGSYDGKGCSIAQAWACLIKAAPPAPEAGWQPIETGPVNVEVLALYKGRRHVIAMQLPPDYSPGGWCHREAFGNDGPFRGLTHWAPLLPTPPAGTNTTEGEGCGF